MTVVEREPKVELRMSARRCLGALVAFAVVALGAWTAPAAANPYTPGAGEILVDSGFRPDANGYSFANYGNEGNPNNLSAGSMRKLFGDAAVCVGGGGTNGSCTLTPAARNWAVGMNKVMAGGHCAGFAITASYFYAGVGQPPTPDPFGSPTVPGLALQGNTGIQNHIATAFVLQFLQPMTSTKLNQSPNEVLSAIAQNLGSAEPMMIGVYKRGFVGGHAITPIAIEDRGGGQAAIIVYDNNFPNTLREINIDTNANTWNYVATPNPSEPTGLYEGDADSRTLEVWFAGNGLGTQPCPFCGRSARQDDTEAAGQLIWSGNPRDGEHSNVSIVDSDGNIADAEGSSIPGVESIPVKLGRIDDGGEGDDGAEGEVGSDGEAGEPVWESSPPPVFNVPDGMTFDVELDGEDLESSVSEGLSFVNDGVSLGVDDLRLRDGDDQTLEIGPHSIELDNQSGHDVAPTLTFGEESGGDGFEITVEADGVDDDADLRVAAKPGERMKLDFAADGNDDAGVQVEVVRVDADGDRDRARTRELTLEDGEDGVISFNGRAMRHGKLKLRD